MLADILILAGAISGTGLLVYQLYLNGWGLDEMLFEEEDEK